LCKNKIIGKIKVKNFGYAYNLVYESEGTQHWYDTGEIKLKMTFLEGQQRMTTIIRNYSRSGKMYKKQIILGTSF